MGGLLNRIKEGEDRWVVEWNWREGIGRLLKI